MTLTKIFLTLSLVTSGVLSKGINCEGSTSCDGISFAIGSLEDVCNNLCAQPDGGVVANGVHLAESCNRVKEGLAAFYQNTPVGGNVQAACVLCRKLQDHGCKRCGSVPLEGNDISVAGELTVNAVLGSCNSPCSVDCV
jgi:hypothetical protein